MKVFLTRRQALQEAAVGFGAMVVNSMLQRDRLFAAESASASRRSATSRAPTRSQCRIATFHTPRSDRIRSSGVPQILQRARARSYTALTSSEP